MMRYAKFIMTLLLLSQSNMLAKTAFENEYYKIEFHTLKYVGAVAVRKPLAENEDISKNYLLRANADNSYDLQYQRCNLKPQDSVYYQCRLILKKNIAEYSLQGSRFDVINNDTTTIYPDSSTAILKHNGIEVCKVRYWIGYARMTNVKLIYDNEPQVFVSRSSQTDFKYQIKTCNGYINPKKIKAEVQYTYTLFGHDGVIKSQEQTEFTLYYKKAFNFSSSVGINTSGPDTLIRVNVFDTTATLASYDSNTCYRYIVKLSPLDNPSLHTLAAPKNCVYEDDTLRLRSKSEASVNWFRNGVLFASNTAQLKVTDPGIYNYSLSSTTETTCENNSNSVHIGECREFKGMVFLDSLSNDTLDASEHKISNIKLYIPELNKTFFTDENGHFGFEVPQTSNYFSIIVADNAYLNSVYKFYYNPIYKDYTINHYNILTGKYFSSIQKDQIFLKLYTNNSHDKDAGVTMISSAIRPGFDNKHTLTVSNHGSEALQGVLTLEYVSPLYDPNKDTESTAGPEVKKVQWPVDLASGAQTTIVHPLKTLTTATLGTYVSLKAYIVVPDDGERINDTAYASIQIRGSFDPNDKSVSPVGPHYEEQILKNTKLDYTIRFQNTGTDTAFKIVVKDTLDSRLDPKSLIMKKASHKYNLFIVDHIMTWTFNNILLVDSTTNEPLSHGFIQYNVQQKTNNPEGTEIRNQAAIYFDFNKPVMTNVTYNKVVNSLPTELTHIIETGHNDHHLVYPNPSNGYLTVFSQLNSSFKLVDQTGRVLLQSTVVAGSQSLDISHLEPGIYYYSFEGSKSQKLLIQ